MKISMDGKGRLWRTVKYEEVYLKANAVEARKRLGEYFLVLQ